MAQWFPWDDLPVDVLHHILDLFDIPDLIRLSLVCTSFEHVVYGSPKFKRWAQNNFPSPWIMLRPSENPCNGDSEISTQCYSLSEDKIYEIKLENSFRSWRLIGTSYGWLIMADDESNLHLINPMKKRHIALPPVINMGGIRPLFNHKKNLVRYKLRGFGKIKVSELRKYYTRVVLSRDPSEGEFIVMLVCVPQIYGDGFRTKARVSFVKEGEESWTLLDKTTTYHDFVFHNGLFYGATELGGIDALDVSESLYPKIKTVVPDFIDLLDSDSVEQEVVTLKYITVTPRGKIWVLTQWYGIELEIEVYEVDILRRTMIRIENLGNNSIFVGPNSSCFCTKKLPNIRSNCVFFIDHFFTTLEFRRVGVYDLLGGSFDYEVFGDMVPLDWITPNCF